MSHLNVDVIDFILLTIYPVLALFIIEIICRSVKIASWLKLLAQAVACMTFGLAYLTLITAHWLTAIVLFALSVALFYQARLSKIKPSQSI